MNITQTFRRKNKFHKPILVFKQLYRDYFSHNSPNRDYQPRTTEPFSDSFEKKKSLSKKDVDPILKKPKTNSAEQLSKYLHNHGDPGVSILKSTLKDDSTLKRSKSSQNNSYVFKLMERTQLQQLERSKRSYFTNSYTKSHPFFQKAHEFFKEKPIDEKESNIPKILPQIFKETSTNCKKPEQKRVELKELKCKFIDRKQMAVEKFQKIRHNFLLRKNYKPRTETETQPFTQRTLSDVNLFSVTKENIFPSPGY